MCECLLEEPCEMEYSLSVHTVYTLKSSEPVVIPEIDRDFALVEESV